METRTVIVLWKDNVPHKALRVQLNMSTLKRILAFDRANPVLDPDAE
jgi:hypothetical protein